MKRLTTDTPDTITSRMLNFAFAKDKRVVLRYAGGEEDADLCEYIAANVSDTTDCQITAEEVMDGACLECCSPECPIGCLYFAAVQAAELRERLKYYEDKEENAGGEWVYGENDIPHCSKCGFEPKEISTYCPECGAPMEDEEVDGI